MTPEKKICRQKTCPRRCSEGSRVIDGGMLGRVGLVFGAGGRTRTARQREGFVFIERADAALVEARFLDLQVGAVQRVRRQFLDREANRFRRGAKTPIGKPGPLLLADRGGKQFGGGVVAEGTHGCVEQKFNQVFSMAWWPNGLKSCPAAARSGARSKSPRRGPCWNGPGRSHSRRTGR